MKTANSKHFNLRALLIFGIFPILFSCLENERFNQKDTSQLEKIASKYGFELKETTSKNNPNERSLHLKSDEVDLFFQYLRNARKDPKSVNYSELSEIFERNSFNEYKVEEKEKKSRINIIGEKSAKIQCVQNAHLVNARITNMPFPGLDEGLNGVNIEMGISNGELNTSSFTMYGFYPFLGVRGGNLNQDIIPNASNGYTYGFQAVYTVSYSLFIDGTEFLTYERVNLLIRIDGCSGQVSWYYQNP